MAGNTATVLEFLQVFHTSSPDWARMASFLSETACYHVRFPASAGLHGRDAIRDEIETQFRLYQDCVCEIHAVGADGRFVFTERTDHVTMRRDGRRVSARICGVFEIDAAGRIAAWRDYYDPVPVYQQIGLSEQDLYATAQ